MTVTGDLVFSPDWQWLCVFNVVWNRFTSQGRCPTAVVLIKLCLNVSNVFCVKLCASFSRNVESWSLESPQVPPTHVRRQRLYQPSILSGHNLPINHFTRWCWLFGLMSSKIEGFHPQIPRLWNLRGCLACLCSCESVWVFHSLQLLPLHCTVHLLVEVVGLLNVRDLAHRLWMWFGCEQQGRGGFIAVFRMQSYLDLFG